jgi:phage terminase large subunit
MNAGAYFGVQDAVIKAPYGGVITFQGMQSHNAESIKSLEDYDIAYVEEAQTLSQKSLDLLRPTIRKAGSEMWFAWNPRHKTDPVEALLCGDSPPPGTVVVTATYRDNPWLSEETLRDIAHDQKRDPDKYQHIWLGGYEQHSESRVFRNWRVEEFESPTNAPYRLGADWGFAADPSVLIRARIDGRTLYVDYEAYMVGCEIDMLPDLFDGVPDSRKWFITADSARPETISYMKHHGYPKITPAVKGKNSLAEGVEFLKSFDIIVHPRCQNTIDELTMYRYKIDPLSGRVMPLLDDKHNHVIDALRYACEGARRTAQSERPPIDERMFRPSVTAFPASP